MKASERPTRPRALNDRVRDVQPELAPRRSIGPGRAGGTRPLTASQVLTLQRAAGNRATTTLVRASGGHPSSPSQVKNQGAAVQSRDIAVQRTTPVVQRDVSVDDRTWARKMNGELKRIQHAVQAAEKDLNTDAKTAVAALTGVQKAYTAYEKKYYQAVDDFVSGLEEAQADERELRATIGVAVDILLFATTGPWMKATSAVAKVAQAVSEIKGFAGIIGNVGRLAGPPNGPSRKYPGPPPEVDWAAAMGNAIKTLKSYAEENEVLDSIDERCLNYVDFLDDVRNGTYQGPDPRTSREGVAVTALVSKVESITAKLSLIGPGTISAPATEFKALAIPRLESQTGREIERDLAIRWISGLNKAQLDEIDQGDAYLEEIGIINENGNILNYDTGIYTTDVDEKLIWLLAISERMAMKRIGDTATWLRTTIRGKDRTAGIIRDELNRYWAALVAGTRAPERGAPVQIIEYVTSREERSKWTSYGRSEVEQMSHEIVFYVRSPGARRFASQQP